MLAGKEGADVLRVRALVDTTRQLTSLVFVRGDYPSDGRVRVRRS